MRTSTRAILASLVVLVGGRISRGRGYRNHVESRKAERSFKAMLPRGY